MDFHQFQPGAQPSAPDPRDYLFDHTAVLAARPVPDEMDMRPNMGPVWDQGSIGSCGAHGGGAAYAYRMSRKHRGGRWVVPARRAIYFWARRYAGQQNVDAGVQLRNLMKALANEGAPSEDLFPYLPALFAQEPPPEVVAAGQLRQALIYERVAVTPEAWKAALAADLPVVFGAMLYESFFRPVGGIIPMPQAGERRAGGHCMAAVGWSATRQAFLIRNSWGPGWSEGGYSWLPAAYLVPQLTWESFVLKLVEG